MDIVTLEAIPTVVIVDQFSKDKPISKCIETEIREEKAPQFLSEYCNLGCNFNCSNCGTFFLTQREFQNVENVGLYSNQRGDSGCMETKFMKRTHFSQHILLLVFSSYNLSL